MAMRLLAATPAMRALIIGLVALVARILFIAVAGRDVDLAVPGDHVAYSEFARLMMSGPGWITHPLAVREPLYPALMALAYSLPGGDVGVLQVVQALLGAAAAAVLYMALRRFTGEVVALLCGVTVALHPHFVPMTAFPLRENLIIPLVVGFVGSYLGAMEGYSRKRLLIHAMFIALLVHTDVRFLPLVVVFPVMALASHRDFKRAVRQTAWMALFLMLLMVPYQLRCYAATGQPVIVTERFLGRWLQRAGAVSSRDARSDASREEWLAAWEARKLSSLDMLTADERAYFTSGGRPALGRAEVHWFLFKEYWRFARLDPLYRAYPDGRFEPPWSLRHNFTSSLVMVPFIVLVPVFLVLATPAARRIAYPLLIYLLAHNVMHVLVHARERYRIPLEVITGLVVAMSLVLLWERYVSPRRPRGGGDPWQ